MDLRAPSFSPSYRVLERNKTVLEQLACMSYYAYVIYHFVSWFDLLPLLTLSFFTIIYFTNFLNTTILQSKKYNIVSKLWYGLFSVIQKRFPIVYLNLIVLDNNIAITKREETPASDACQYRLARFAVHIPSFGNNIVNSQKNIKGFLTRNSGVS